NNPVVVMLGAKPRRGGASAGLHCDAIRLMLTNGTVWRAVGTGSVFGMAMVALSLVFALPAHATETYTARVVSITDADTFKALYEGRARRARPGGTRGSGRTLCRQCDGSSPEGSD